MCGAKSTFSLAFVVLVLSSMSHAMSGRAKTVPIVLSDVSEPVSVHHHRYRQRHLSGSNPIPIVTTFQSYQGTPKRSPRSQRRTIVVLTVWTLVQVQPQP